MNNNLVSIIIPNYNRATLINNTLESVISQTYQNWECIIIDDRSTDNSIEVIKNYEEKDKRLILIQRPIDYPKGANACRNIGLQKSKGDYIIFFDSDDLMTRDHLEQKIVAILSGNYDFVVAKTKYFNNPNNINPINYRELYTLRISADNFIMKKINWLTLDLIIKSDIAKSIQFTENENSAEEYNYFVKLVLKTSNALSIENVLSLRRYHEDSVQYNLNNNSKIALNQFHYYFDTYLEVKDLNISKESKNFLINQSLYIYFKNKKLLKKYALKLYIESFKNFGLINGSYKIIKSL